MLHLARGGFNRGQTIPSNFVFIIGTFDCILELKADQPHPRNYPFQLWMVPNVLSPWYAFDKKQNQGSYVRLQFGTILTFLQFGMKKYSGT